MPTVVKSKANKGQNNSKSKTTQQSTHSYKLTKDNYCDPKLTEQWKPIKDYEGLYEVSSFGRIKSCKRIIMRRNGIKQTFQERILRPLHKDNGYLTVALSKQGKESNRYIHRLVASAFISNPHHYQEVNHIDEDKTNNSVSNLEWCTHTYNNNYGTKKERTAITNLKRGNYQCFGHRMQKINGKPLIAVNEKEVKKFPSTHEAARVLGFCQVQIAYACRNHGEYKGYRWDYV